MKPLRLDELASPATFEALRPELRKAILAHKAVRRVAVGDRVTLLFEDRETVRWQVLEMSRVEGLHEPHEIQAELDVYNELVPGERELSATLFIEITDLTEIRPELDRLIGLDETVTLQIGSHTVRATFDDAQMEEDRISAVHYIRFRLTSEAALAFGDADVLVSLRVDHAAYQAEAVLPALARASLAADLRGGAAELVPLGDAPRADQGDRDVELERRGGARLIRPARPKAPGHVIVEPLEGAPSLREADDALLLELFALAREAAARVEAQHGTCRLLIDATLPVRIELYATPRQPPAPARTRA